jgi:hypothetical protein
VATPFLEFGVDGFNHIFRNVEIITEIFLVFWFESGMHCVRDHFVGSTLHREEFTLRINPISGQDSNSNKGT